MSRASRARPIEGTRRDVLKFDQYVTAVCETNPFASNRITEPSSYDVDVPEIHAAEFDRLVALSRHVMRQRSAVGVALLGAAGVGKSHLLSRLYRWANTAAEGGGVNACYVYLHNVLADPERLPRYLLKYVISRLSEGGRGPLHQTPLYRFVDRAIHHALDVAGAGVEMPEGRIRTAWEAYRGYFGDATGPRAAYDVLFQFWRFARPEKAAEPGRRNLALSALGWLSGDEIDPVFAARLGFRADRNEPVMLHDDQEVEHVLLSLTRLALVSQQPLVLCIDQVENLDPDKLKPLVRFLHTLLDQATNLLIIISGVKETLLRYRKEDIIPEAAWDRIAQYKADLKRVRKSEARKILEARLERFHEPFLEVDPVRRRLHEDTLFPLGRAWLEDRFGDAVEFRPRDVLTWARDAWDEESANLARLGGQTWVRRWPDTCEGKGGSGGKVGVTAQNLETIIDGAVDRKIEEQIAENRLQPGSVGRWPRDGSPLVSLRWSRDEHGNLIERPRRPPPTWLSATLWIPRREGGICDAVPCPSCLNPFRADLSCSCHRQGAAPPSRPGGDRSRRRRSDACLRRSRPS